MADAPPTAACPRCAAPLGPDVGDGHHGCPSCRGVFIRRHAVASPSALLDRLFGVDRKTGEP